MDAFELLKQLPDKSVDLVLTDPPYFQVMKTDWKGQKYDWDNQWKTIKDYQEWILKLGKEIKRILKSNGSFYIFADDKICAYVQVVLDEIFELENFITWVKPNNLTIKGWTQYKSFSPITEKILFYSKEYGWDSSLTLLHQNKDCFKEIKEYLWSETEKLGMSWEEINRELLFTTSKGGGGRAYNMLSRTRTRWDMIDEKNYLKLQKSGRFKKQYMELREDYEKKLKEYKDLLRVFNPEKNFTDVWTFNIMGGSESVKHPTQKPLKIIERIIKTSSKKEDLILDCFVGSGTTAVACKQLGRNFICCDNNAGYVEICKKRLAQQSVADFTSATPTFVSQKEFNKGLEVPTSSPPKSPSATSPNPNIKEQEKEK